MFVWNHQSPRNARTPAARIEEPAAWRVFWWGLGDRGRPLCTRGPIFPFLVTWCENFEHAAILYSTTQKFSLKAP